MHVVLTNQLVSEIHDRMPVIPDLQGMECWLNPEIEDPQELGELLRPFAAH